MAHFFADKASGVRQIFSVFAFGAILERVFGRAALVTQNAGRVAFPIFISLLVLLLLERTFAGIMPWLSTVVTDTAASTAIPCIASKISVLLLPSFSCNVGVLFPPFFFGHFSFGWSLLRHGSFWLLGSRRHGGTV